MACILKRVIIKVALALYLLQSAIGFANVIDVTIPPDTDVAYVSTNATINLEGPLKATQNWSSFGLVSVSPDGAYCIAADNLFEDDDHYYFGLMNEDDDLVGFFALSYYVTASWVRYDGSHESGSARIINGEVVQIDNFVPVDGNPYCLNPPDDGNSDLYFNASENRSVDITVTGGLVYFNSPDDAVQGNYTIALENGERVDTLYGASLSRQEPGDLSQVLISSINIEILDACTLDVSGDTSPEFYVDRDQDSGYIDYERVTIDFNCDSETDNTLIGSVRLQTGYIKDNTNEFYLVNEDYETGSLYIEGIINGNGSDCSGEGNILFNGETFPIDDDLDVTGDSFDIDWNLCKDDDELIPGEYYGALDLSLFFK